MCDRGGANVIRSRAVLLLSCAAMLCGYRRYGAIAEWRRNYGPEMLRALGFTGAVSPCAATLYLIFKRVDAAALEAALGRWAEEVLAARPAEEGEREVVAIDGKTPRGSRKQAPISSPPSASGWA